MKQKILKDARNLYIKRIKENLEFCRGQHASHINTGAEEMKSNIDFINSCINAFDTEIKYPDEYTDLQKRILYFGLSELKGVLSDKTWELNNKLMVCKQDEKFVELTMELKENFDENLICGELLLEFINLYFDGDGKIKKK